MPPGNEIKPFIGPSGYRAVSSSGGAIQSVEGITSANSLFFEESTNVAVAKVTSPTN